MPTMSGRRRSIDRSGRPKSAKSTNSSLSFLRILFPRHVQLREPIPRMLKTPRPALDEEAYHFLAFLVRDFIQTWYSAISTDPDFVSSVVNVVIHIAHELERRCQEVDWVELLLIDVPVVLKKHYKDYRQATQTFGTAYAPNQTLESIFHGLQPHFALSDGQESEIEYLRQLSDELLRVLPPEDEYESDLVRWLVREILACIVLRSLVELLTEPDMINYIINTLLSSFGPLDAEYEELIKAARDEAQSKENFMLSMAALRPKASVKWKVVHKSTTPSIDPTDDMVDMLQEAQSSILETPFNRQATHTSRRATRSSIFDVPNQQSQANGQPSASTDTSQGATVKALFSQPTSPDQTSQYTTLASNLPQANSQLGQGGELSQPDVSLQGRRAPQSTDKMAEYVKSLSNFITSLSTIIMATLTFLAALPTRVQQGLKTVTWIYTELDTPVHHNLETGLLDLANEIFFLQDRNRVVWRQWEIMGWPLVRALGGDAIDRLLTRGVQWIFAEKQLIFYLEAGRKALWPDPKVSSPPRPRGVHEMEEARREAEQRILRAIPASLRDLFFGKEGASHLAAAQDAMEPFQNKICNKHLIHTMSDSIKEATETSMASTPTTTDDKYSKSTLFVRGLPFEATSAQLEAFFSEVGPVRSCFVVLDKSAEQAAAESEQGEKKGIAAAAATPSTAVKNKGFGFVQFVLPDDADRAIEELRNVKFLKQRPLIMEKALKKAAHDSDHKAKGEGKPQRTSSEPKRPKDQKQKQQKQKPKEEENDGGSKEKNYSFQTVILKGVGENVTKKHIYKRVRKVGDVKEVIYPVSTKDEATGTEKVEEGTAHIIYATAQLANQAVKQLDGHIFKGSALHAALLATPSVYKRCRLIVRNLPWKYRETELKDLFSKYGVVQEVNLPRKYEGGPLRGFGFIQMVSLDEAEKAITNLNGTEHHGRTIAVDWALSKDRFEEAEANAATTEEAPAAEGANDDVEMKEAKSEEDEEMEDRQHPQDEGSDEDNEEADGSDEDNEEDEEIELNLDHHKNSDSEDEEDNSDAEDDEKNPEDDENLEADLAALDAEEEREKQAKHALPDPSEGTTLFIRNLDFEATKEDLFELFRHWGKLRYCRVTMDPETGRSRGTGFVCYYNKGAADNCMADAERVHKIMQPIQQENDRRKQKNNFVKGASLLAPDLPEELAVKFTLNGRVLNVVRAVDKKAAEDLTAAGQHKRERLDKRNLYLMREGVIFPDSPAAAKITPSELSKRQASYAARRQLLARNPSLYISKTRLSIRNLPLKMDEKELRKLGIAAIQKFKNEVKAGKRAHLSAEEQAEGWDKKVFIKQAKIVRSKDRVDASTQKLRSKGYGFLEYSHHAHALAGLRWLNNNPTLFGEKKCLIVEFSIENVVVNKHREDRMKNASAKRKHGDDAQENEQRQENDEESKERKRPRRSIHEGGGNRDRDQKGGKGRGRGGHNKGEGRDASRKGGRGGARGGGRGGRGGRGRRQ
ncbi:RNA recognition motif-containing protein [Actinomortierella wolfii]|nr:RNA recognition motif-containing protein [Actinomortierella wolfii]